MEREAKYDAVSRPKHYCIEGLEQESIDVIKAIVEHNCVAPWAAVLPLILPRPLALRSRKAARFWIMSAPRARSPSASGFRRWLPSPQRRAPAAK